MSCEVASRRLPCLFITIHEVGCKWPRAGSDGQPQMSRASTHQFIFCPLPHRAPPIGWPATNQRGISRGSLMSLCTVHNSQGYRRSGNDAGRAQAQTGTHTAHTPANQRPYPQSFPIRHHKQDSRRLLGRSFPLDHRRRSTTTSSIASDPTSSSSRLYPHRPARPRIS